MKKIFLPLLLVMSLGAANAQVASLHENFDVSCATSMGFPYGWTTHNPVSGTDPSGAWGCTPTLGNGGTPGMTVTGIYGSPASDHLDTAYLISPLLDLSGVTGNVYLRFDTRTSRNHSGGRLKIVAASYPDSTISHSDLDSDITSAMSPVFSNADSTGWVTHEVALTSFTSSTNFYVSFMYVSTDTSGSTWFLDNVLTTKSTLGVSKVPNTPLPLSIVGNSTSDEMEISYDAPVTGQYQLMVYDLMGRVVFRQMISTAAGPNEYRINGLNLQPGMYLVKMSNESCYGTAKTVVR